MVFVYFPHKQLPPNAALSGCFRLDYSFPSLLFLCYWNGFYHRNINLSTNNLLEFPQFLQEKVQQEFGTALSCNALLKRPFAENVWQWRTLVSESDTHFQKLSLSPVCE